MKINRVRLEIKLFKIDAYELSTKHQTTKFSIFVSLRLPKKIMNIFFLEALVVLELFDSSILMIRKEKLLFVLYSFSNDNRL